MVQKNKGTAEYIQVMDGYLEIRLKLQPGHPSSTGRNFIRVTTGGFKPADGDGDIRVNVTAISKTAK
jgi:hypothetical protein